MLDGRRKSMQPMAERLGVDHQRLQQFVTSSTWDYAAVRRRLARRAVEVVAPEAWVVDDTGFPKDGDASPCVARQYSGTLGKVGQLPDRGQRARGHRRRLVPRWTGGCSCPNSWDDTLRRRPGAGRADRGPAAALRASPTRSGTARSGGWRWRCSTSWPAWGLRPPLVVADAGYGDDTAFRLGLTERGLPLRGRGQGRHQRPPGRRGAGDACRYCGRGRPPGAALPHRPVSLRELALAAGRAGLRRVTWRQGTKHTKGNPTATMRSRFLALRVRPANRDIPRARRRHPARVLAARPMATRRARAHRLLAVHPARRHPAAEPGPPGQDPLADRARLPRTEDRPRPGPLRGPLLHRLAPPRHPGHRRPPVPHRTAADQPKSSCAGLTLYKILHQLQVLLATWTGPCPTCHQRPP